MKYIFFLPFLLLVACMGNKNTYVCGDHPCINKKEFKEYFAENLIIEIQTQSPNKKNSTVDLVKLNTATFNSNKKGEIFSEKENKLRLKEEKAKLKEERKIKKIEKKNKIKQKKKLAKISKFNKNDGSVMIDKTIDNNSSKIDSSKIKIKKDKVPKKEVASNSVKIENTLSICSEIKDCDIDKIAELLIKKGSEKGFPNITSN